MSLAIRGYIAEKTEIKAIKFITSNIIPPLKKAVLAALGIPLATGQQPEAPSTIIRKAESDVCVFLSSYLPVPKHML